MGCCWGQDQPKQEKIPLLREQKSVESKNPVEIVENEPSLTQSSISEPQPELETSTSIQPERLDTSASSGEKAASNLLPLRKKERSLDSPKTSSNSVGEVADAPKSRNNSIADAPRPRNNSIADTPKPRNNSIADTPSKSRSNSVADGPPNSSPQHSHEKPKHQGSRINIKKLTINQEKKTIIKTLAKFISNRPKETSLLEKSILHEELSIPFRLDIIKALIEKLVQLEAKKEEGIFRISGNFQKIRSLYLTFRTVLDLSDAGPHEVAGVLKYYLRELSPPLVAQATYARFIDAMNVEEENVRIQQLRETLNSLPTEKKQAFQIIIKFLQEISTFSALNLMNSRNLGIVFGPTMLSRTDPNISSGCNAITFCIDHYLEIFEVFSRQEARSALREQVEPSKIPLLKQISSPEMTNTTFLPDKTYSSDSRLQSNIASPRFSEVFDKPIVRDTSVQYGIDVVQTPHGQIQQSKVIANDSKLEQSEILIPSPNVEQGKLGESQTPTDQAAHKEIQQLIPEVQGPQLQIIASSTPEEIVNFRQTHQAEHAEKPLTQVPQIEMYAVQQGKANQIATQETTDLAKLNPELQHEVATKETDVQTQGTTLHLPQLAQESQFPVETREDIQEAQQTVSNVEKQIEVKEVNQESPKATQPTTAAETLEHLESEHRLTRNEHEKYDESELETKHDNEPKDNLQHEQTKYETGHESKPELDTGQKLEQDDTEHQAKNEVEYQSESEPKDQLPHESQHQQKGDFQTEQACQQGKQAYETEPT